MERKKQELKKHVATIHCSNTLSLLQRKISNALLFHAYDRLMQQEEHEISVKYLCSLIAYKGHNHGAIKTALKHLISVVVEWNLVNDKAEEDWSASTLLASVRIKGPLCMYAYSPRMKALLHLPSIYGKISLTIQAQFKSSYGLALYENCVRYKNLSYTRWFDLAMFRRLMGVPDDQYLIFRDFKRRVLDKSMEEVNAYSELWIEAETQKQGRAVNTIRFLIKEKSASNSTSANTLITNVVAEQEISPVLVQLPIQQKLINSFGVSEQQAEEIIKSYPADYVRAKIHLVEQSVSFKKGRVENITGYLLNAIKNNYQSGLSKHDKLLQHKIDQREKEHSQKLALIEQEQQQKEYFNYINGIINQVIDNFTIQQKEKLQQDFEKNYFYENHLEAVYGQIYRNQGFASATIQNFFRDFLRSHHAELIPSLVSFEEFIVHGNLQTAI